MGNYQTIKNKTYLKSKFDRPLHQQNTVNFLVKIDVIYFLADQLSTIAGFIALKMS